MNIYMFNPQYVKTSTLNYLCKIFKVKSVYNLIQDDYVDEYISNLNCKVVYNIRNTNFYNKDAAWKQGVYNFVDTVFSKKNSDFYYDAVDIQNSKANPFYNIKHCGVINVMVLHNKHMPDTYEYLYELKIEEDFIAYARNIIMKNWGLHSDDYSIGNILVGLNINCFISPIKGSSYYYRPFVNRYDNTYYKWCSLLLRSKRSGKEFDPTAKFILDSYRKDFLNNSKEPIKVKYLLTEDGKKARLNFHYNYKLDLEYRAQIEGERAEAEAEVSDWKYELKSMRDEFNSEMNDHEAWSNID